MKRIAVAVVVALLLIGATPLVRSHVKGALLTLEVVGSPVRPLSWLTPAPDRREIKLGATPADLYRARGWSRQAGLVLVHGANPQGKDDPRVVDLASALARAGRRVLVPELGLRRERLDPDDLERILDAIDRLASDGPVGVLAFSYGGGLTLVALGDHPSAQKDVAFVATVGTYYDIRHILQGVTTQTVPYRGSDVPWEPDPRARDVLARQLAFLLGGDEGRSLRRAWERRDRTVLGPEAQRAYALLANRRPERVDELIQALPHRLRRIALGLSPSNVVENIGVPVLALHARDDPASPPTESRLLIDALSGRVETHLTEAGNLRHVTPTSPRDVSEGLKIAGFAARVLRVHEGWPRL